MKHSLSWNAKTIDSFRTFVTGKLQAMMANIFVVHNKHLMMRLIKFGHG